MKYRLRYILGTGLIAGIMVAAPIVLAENSNTSTSSDSGTTTTETTDVHDRLERLKLSLKINLTAAESTHIKLRCRPAQSVVAKLNTRFGNSVTRRTQAYTELSTNLGKLIDKLKAKGVDTATLEQEKTTLDAKITTYKTDLATYQQSLSDLKAVDCLTNPDEFQAALQTARTDHEQLVTDVTDIKTYVLNTIKQTLMTIRSQLEAQSTTNSSTGGSN